MIDSTLLPPHNSARTVVPFQNAEDFTACKELYAYWQALRGTRQMPARSEFDPRAVEATLACTFVAEKVAPSVARIRVAGSLLNETLGMDVRGMPITAIFDPASREALAEASRDLFASPAMVVLELSTRRRFNRKPLRARLLMLPMSDAQGTISRLVGCLDIVGDLGKTPHRFEITSIRRTDVIGDAPVATREKVPSDPALRVSIKKPSYAFAEGPATFAPQRAQAAAPRLTRAKLQLVVNND